MRKAGGILTIIGGIMGIVFGAFMAGLIVKVEEDPFFAWGIVALIVGIVALIGGIYALRARFWGVALAGGIVLIGIGAGFIDPWFRVIGPGPGDQAGLILLVIVAPLSSLGILGTIFIKLRKGEFE